MVSAAGAPVLPDSRAGCPWLVLAVCSASVFLIGLDSTIVTIGLPDIGQALHAGVNGLQWSSTAYTVALASLLMWAGSAADRLGRRPMLQAGLAVFVLGSWLCSEAPNLPCLVAFRVIQGIGGSAMNPSALGIITNVFTDPGRRAKAIGVWDAVYGLSMVTGPLAGGLLISLAGWRAIFWASIPPGLAALALTGLLAPDSRAPCPRRSDPVAQILVIIMLAALCAAIIQAPSWGWISLPTILLASGAAMALAGLLQVEPHRAEPLIQFSLYRRPAFAAASVTAVAGIAALAGFGFLTSLYLQDVREMSALRAGLTMWPMAAEMAVCAPLAGRILARHGARPPALAAGAVMAASSVALSFLSAGSSAAFLAITYSLFGAGIGVLNPVITYSIMSSVADGQAGLASGMNSASRQLGQCIGVAVTGSALAGSLRGSMEYGFLSAARPSWWIMAGCGTCVLLATLVGTPRRHAAPRARGRHARPRGARSVGVWRGTALPGRPASRRSPASARHARRGGAGSLEAHPSVRR